MEYWWSVTGKWTLFIWKWLYLNRLEWESVCWRVWLEGSEIHLVRELLGGQRHFTSTRDLVCNPFKGKRKICRIPPLCLLREEVVMTKHSIVSCGTERFLVVPEVWLDQTFSNLIHLPLKSRLLSYIPSVTTSHLFRYTVPSAFVTSTSPSGHPLGAL